MDSAFDELLRAFAECEFDAFDRAEEICDNGKCRAFYVREKQSLSLFVDDPAMDLGDLEIRVDRSRDLDDFVLILKRTDEGAEVFVHRGARAQKRAKAKRFNLPVFARLLYSDANALLSSLL